MSGRTVSRMPVTDDGVAGHFSGPVARDFFSIMAGKWLGGGVGRGVYVLNTDSSLVVKIETASYSFQNVAEWEAWGDLNDMAGDSASKWFAPCYYISPCGAVLIQARTRPLDRSLFPKKMPSFFTDLKYQNFGTFEGRVVAHDYGYHRFVPLGATARMRNADWRDDEES